MDDITLLHLSDLHIGCEACPRVLDDFLLDLQEQKKEIRSKIVIVVTGDIIDKGVKYASSSDAYQLAYAFFKRLHNIVHDICVGIYIVPGNHDKYRGSSEKFLVPHYRYHTSEYNPSKSPFDNDFFNTIWDFHKASYTKEKGTGYLDLIREINQLFSTPNEKIQSNDYFTDTFGVDILDINNFRFCFIMLNTAWSCIDDQDTRNLILGKFQLTKLQREYQQVVAEKRPDLTIVIGHHPLSFLNGKEEDYLFNTLSAYDGFDANIYLCGHVHDYVVNNWVNNRHSINTFVTGFGWRDEGVTHVGSHTYAIYTLNLDANSIDVYMRETKGDGKFSPNFRIYTSEEELLEQKLTFPIRSHETQTHISLSAAQNESAKSFYLSEKLLSYIRSFVINLARFSNEIGAALESDKQQFYDQFDTLFETDATDISEGTNNDSNKDNQDNIDIDYTYGLDNGDDDDILYTYLFGGANGAIIENESEDTYYEKVCKTAQEILKEPECRKNIFELFTTYLSRICQKLQSYFVDEDSNEIVRFHFRYLADKTSFIYKQLCISVPKVFPEMDYLVSDMQYGELLKTSFETHKGLIYSVNKKQVIHPLKEKWHDFYTLVPQFTGNIYQRDYGRSRKNFPFITFGVTINSASQDKLLYCFDYFSIQYVLENMIEDFIKVFPIDMSEYCQWLNKSLENK